MAAIITPTGATIIRIAGPQISYVGSFTADDIDLDISNNTPNSKPEILETEIRDLITAAGKDPDALTDLDAAYGNTALLWACWVYYWEMSRQGEGCPSECADDQSYYRKRNWACKQVCANGKSIGIKWGTYCSGKDAALMLNMISGRAIKSCPDEIIND